MESGSGLGRRSAELCVVGGLGAHDCQAPSPETADQEVALGALGLPGSGFAHSVGLSKEPKDSEMSPVQAQHSQGEGGRRREKAVAGLWVSATGVSSGPGPSTFRQLVLLKIPGTEHRAAVDRRTHSGPGASPPQLSQRPWVLTEGAASRGLFLGLLSSHF